MSRYFADTFFFIALLFENDESHARAHAIVGSLAGRIYTSEWILTELGDALAVPGRREMFLPFLEFLRTNPLITIVQFNEVIFNRGCVLFDQRRDKAWSLTDCVSFVIMHDLELYDALTGDHHFEQAGFHVLMK